jgi:DNA-binding MarR family transcriptional regulator
MPIVRHPANLPPDLVTAVAAAARPLVMVWGRADGIAQTQASAPQLRALVVVGHHGSLNLNQLADELGVIPSSASRLCDRLVASGLLDRKVSEQNRREVVLTLRTEGQGLLETVEHDRRDALADVLKGMRPGGRKALLSGLEAFAEVVGQMVAEQDQWTA